MNENKMLQVLDKCYDIAILGIPNLNIESVRELSNEYLIKFPIKEIAIEKLINSQIKKCTASGFLTNLGGFLTLPLAIPTNIASVLYIQLRMIACIAYIKGYDIKSDYVKTLIYICLVGSSANDILKNTGIKIGEKFTESMLKKLPGKILIEINKKVGFRLIAKTGTKGVITVGKVVPIVGGLIGSGFDYYTTKKIADFANEKF